MILSMKTDDMVSKWTHLLEGLQIGHSSTGSWATYYSVQVVCTKTGSLMRVQGQGFLTFQPQALVTLEMICFLLVLRTQATAVLLSTIQEMSLQKILSPRNILVLLHK
jgi:hypothetical protein